MAVVALNVLEADSVLHRMLDTSKSVMLLACLCMESFRSSGDCSGLPRAIIIDLLAGVVNVLT